MSGGNVSFEEDYACVLDYDAYGEKDLLLRSWGSLVLMVKKSSTSY